MLVDHIQVWTVQDPVGPIIMLAVWLTLLMLANNIGGVPIPMAMTRLMEIGTLEEQRLLLKKTSRLPLAAVESPMIKDLRERANQISLYEIYNTGVQLLHLALRSATLIAVMLAYGQWIPVTSVCLVAVVVSLVSGKSAESVERLARKQTPDRRLLEHYATLMTKRESAKEIRLFGLNNLLAKRWSDLYEQQARQTESVVFSTEIRKLGPEIMMALISGLLIALLALLPGANKHTAGDFSLLFMALTMLLSQMPGLIGQGVSMKKQYMRWEDFRVYMELEEACDLQQSLKINSAD
ncbi:MAG: transporter ATP-binding protein, partial [Bacilli bacterium]|nr:transporter ATP-binding protein [Bacilli bacterium]